MKRGTASVLSLLLAAVAAFGQDSNKQKLRLSVAVTDDHGTPIRDLAASDFEVESSGKAQAAELRTIRVAESRPAGPREFTNRNHGVLGRGLVVIVLDTMHTRWADEKDMRPMIARYLASLAKKNTPVSLLIMDQSGVLHSVHDFTTSPATLSAALDRADALVHKHTIADDVSPEVAAETQRMADFLRGTIANQTPLTAALRASPEWVLETFRSVAEATAAIPGRKSLLWIVNSSPFEVEDKTHLLASLSVMESGDARFNAVEHRDSLNADDIKKSRPLWKATFASLQRAGVAVYPVAARGSADYNFDPQTLHAMREVAEMTGGREIHVVGDSFAQFANLTDQNVAAYDLTTAPLQGCKSDWCDVKVTVRRPGAKVYAPGGFFRGITIKQDEVFNTAIASPLEFGSLPFVVRFGETQPSGPNKKVGFVVMFPPEAEVPALDSNQLNLEIVARAIAPTGTISQTANFNANSELPAASVDQIRKFGFTLNNAIELAPGEYTVKFLVRERVTGRVGSVSAPLKVS